MKNGVFLLFITTLFISCLENKVTPETDNLLIKRERIDGPANVRDEPNGKIILTLDDNVLVSVGEEIDGWYEVILKKDNEIIFGFTHKNNIKPETIIENSFVSTFNNKNVGLDSWQEFIKTFDLKKNLFEYKEFDTYSNNETGVDDPSPGFRIVLLFHNNLLKCVLNSRKMTGLDLKSEKIQQNYWVTFFDNFPESEQKKVKIYINEWLNGAD